MTIVFDPARAWELDRQVALRPEQFGALAYHFGTRRLSFLKSPKLVGLVTALGEHPTALEAFDALDLEEDEWLPLFRALDSLARSRMIVVREPR